MILPEEYKKKKPEMNVIVDHGSASVIELLAVTSPLAIPWVIVKLLF